MSTVAKRILVVGGTGKTGRRVAERLAEAGVEVRAVSRGSDPRFDWEDEATWRAAVQGMDAAYITYAPDIALPGGVDRVTRFIAIARKAGVDRLVLLTGRGEDEAERAEQALQASGAAWTVVRASWFAQNFDEGLFVDEIRAGRLHFPRLDTPEPFVDGEDIAEVVTAALLDDRHIGKLYELTGPEALTFRQAIATIAQASGRPVEALDISIPDYLAALQSSGVAPEWVQLLELLTTEVLDGRNVPPTQGVVEALGQAPRTFEAYAARVARTGVWASG